MTLRPDALAYPPRGLSHDAAARYIGVGSTKFDDLVRDGRMPAGIKLDSRRVWDRLKLDAAFTDLSDKAETNPLDRMFDEKIQFRL